MLTQVATVGKRPSEYLKQLSLNRQKIIREQVLPSLLPAASVTVLLIASLLWPLTWAKPR